MDHLLLLAALLTALAVARGMLISVRLGPPPAREGDDFDAWPPLSFGGAFEEPMAAVPGMPDLRWLLAQAGVRTSAMSVVAMAACSGGLLLLLGLVRLMPTTEVAAVALAGAAGPLVMLDLDRNRRAALIADSLPSALRSLSRLAGAGHATGSALAAAASEVRGPLGQELRRLAQEQQAGRPLADSLAAMAARAPRCVDLRLLVTAVTLAEESAGDLAALLSRLERTISDRHGMAREAKAKTAQARLQAAVLAAMVPVAALLLLLIAPDYLRDGWSDPLGRVLYQLAGLWAALGGVVIVILLRTKP